MEKISEADSNKFKKTRETLAKICRSFARASPNMHQKFASLQWKVRNEPTSWIGSSESKTWAN